MAVLGTDLLMIERDDVLHKTPVSDLPAPTPTVGTSSGATQVVDFSDTAHVATLDVADTTFTFTPPGGDYGKVDFVVQATYVEPFSGLTSTSPSTSFGMYAYQSPSGWMRVANSLSMIFWFNSLDRFLAQPLGTPDDPSTRTGAITFLTLTEDTTPRGFCLKTDGMQMYLIGGASNTIYAYDFGTDWDASTLTYSATSFSVAGQTTSPQDIWITSDGLTMYVLTSDAGIYEYALSTAWDITTATFTAQRLAGDGGQGFHFSTDGTRLTICGSSTFWARTFDLSVPEDVSSATLNETFVNESSPWKGVHVPEDGLFICLLQANSSGYKYSFANFASISLPTNMQSQTPITTPDFGTKSVYTIVTVDGGTTYQLLSRAEGLS